MLARPELEKALLNVQIVRGAARGNERLRGGGGGGGGVVQAEDIAAMFHLEARRGHSLDFFGATRYFLNGSS